MTRPEVYSITGNSQADLLENGMDTSNKLAWGEPTPSNIAVFETLSKGQIRRILLAKNGTRAEGTRVTKELKAQLNNWLGENKDRDPFLELDEDIKDYGVGPINAVDKKTALRWPKDIVLDKTNDYVFFEFGKYPPPFASDVAAQMGVGDKEIKGIIKKRNAASMLRYNSSALALEPEGKTVILPIPQDLSNEIQQVWQGKQFTATGRAATAALAAGNFGYAKEMVNNLAGGGKALQAQITKMALNSVPGVGGNISVNDVTGVSQGIVINPNAELLYDSPEMREIGMIFKMVPRNSGEADQMLAICKRFREAALPSYGGSPDKKFKFQGTEKTDGKWHDMFSGMNNFIRVPNLCKFTFMRGGEPHPHLIQFKACAIANVEVNYTPDGTYATYSDGKPVAVELRLSFMETKLIFSEEVGTGY